MADKSGTVGSVIASKFSRNLQVYIYLVVALFILHVFRLSRAFRKWWGCYTTG